MMSARSRSPPTSVPSSRASEGTAGCEVGELLAVLGRPHVLEILYTFQGQPGKSIRFRDLQTRLALSPKTLSSRLRALVASGFLTRHSYNEIPPRVEYEPTAKAEELGRLFAVLTDWSRRNNLRAPRVVSVVGGVSKSNS